MPVLWRYACAASYLNQLSHDRSRQQQGSVRVTGREEICEGVAPPNDSTALAESGALREMTTRLSIPLMGWF